MNLLFLTFRSIRCGWLLAASIPLLGGHVACAQTGSVGIGTTMPNAAAALDITATGKGLLIPRMDSAGRVGITSPPTGLLVFQTDGRVGFWYQAGGSWLYLADKSRTGDNLGNHVATRTLQLGNNALTGTGASIGTAVGIGVRADGGLNMAQNTAGNNLYLGYQSGQANTTGDQNQFSGYQSGLSNTTGRRNYFSGFASGQANTAGYGNQFTGFASGGANTTGNFNQFNGFGSGQSNTIGSNNQFDGASSGSSNTTGNNNQFSGYRSGFSNTTGSNNYFSGFQSGEDNTASNNQFVGYLSGTANTTGAGNYFSGYRSGFGNTTGSNNHFAGYSSGQNNTTGSNNTAIGYEAGPTTAALTNATAIGYQSQVSLSNSLVLGNASANVGIGLTAPTNKLDVAGNARFANSSGSFTVNNFGVSSINTVLLGTFTGAGNVGAQLRFAGVGTSYMDLGNDGSGNFVVEGNDNARLTVLNTGNVGINKTNPGYALDVLGDINASGSVRSNGNVITSDQRFKTSIRPLGGALASVLALRGVRYTWNALGVQHGGRAHQEQIGVLAQEVEKIYPELVSTGADGYKAVNYAQLTPVLIEALKEQQAQIEALKTQNATAKAELQTVKAQAAADKAQAMATLETFEARLRRLEAGQAQAQH